jgi:hypothetical protein
MADAMSAVGISEASARTMTPDQWRMVATAAGCRPPNSEDTKEAVYRAMADQAAPVRMTVREWRERTETCSRQSN